MSAPYFGLAGTAPVIQPLTVGAFDIAIRKDVTISNATGASVSYVRGNILKRNISGVFSLFALTDLAYSGDVVAVVDEAVGTGNASTTAFSLDHVPVDASTLVVEVADTVTTAFTFNQFTGVITFTAAPASAAAITASYSYYADIDSINSGLSTDPLLVVLDDELTIATVSTDGGTVVLSGEVDASLLYVGSTKWSSLSSANQLKIAFLLARSGIIVSDVVR